MRSEEERSEVRSVFSSYSEVSAFCECSMEVICVRVLGKCFVRVIWLSNLCECCSEVLCASDLVK
jgi:hypothetical protein